MKIATGTVVKGTVIIDNPEFEDGTDVFILTREREDEVHLSAEELAELEARLQELSLEQSRVMELEGRIDFAERMLLKEPRRDAPLGGTHGAAQ